MSANRLWALVAAAGAGRRLGPGTPKQYHLIGQTTVIDWSIAALLATPDVTGVMVALAEDDAHWDNTQSAHNQRVQTCVGGVERAQSVCAGLIALREQGAADTDWVLVHDAARPAVAPEAIQRLIQAVGEHPDGGLLAIPVRDTLKRADSSARACATLARDALWQAQTPQLFPLGRLLDALKASGDRLITDEAQAMEALGARPLLVEGSMSNLKYTVAGDEDWLAVHLGGARREDLA